MVKKISNSILDISGKIDKTVRSFTFMLNRFFTGLFSILSVLGYAITGLFIAAGILIHSFFYALAAIIGLGALFFMLLAIKIHNTIKPRYARQHHQDLDACAEILIKIKAFFRSEKLNHKETKSIFQTMKDQLKNARMIAKKIDRILKHEHRLTIEVENTSQSTRLSVSEDEHERIIEKITAQKEDIEKLSERANTLKADITKLRLNFNSIYTKLTLLDTSDTTNFDEIETEIQKILNFKLRVKEFEKELDKMNEKG